MRGVAGAKRLGVPANNGRRGGALGAGLAGVLVRTGKYREAAVQASGIQPTATVDSITGVPALLVSSSPPSEWVTRPDGVRGLRA